MNTFKIALARLRTFVCLTLFLLLSSSLTAQCPSGNVSLTSQAEVNAFVAAYPNCTTISGHLTIGSIRSGSNISNITGLDDIQTITGSLNIRNNGSLFVNLHGLHGLQSIGGSLNITGNAYLTSLAGLTALSSIGGELYIYSNSRLSTLEGMNNLSSVGSHINVFGNYWLQSIAALGNLTSVSGNLGIINCNALTSLSGLENITSVSGILTIGDNPLLSSLSGLNRLANLGGTLNLRNNDALINLNGLENLTSINGYCSITNHLNLTSLSGLNNVASISAYFTIQTNENLINLSGLDNLTSIGGDISISNNNNLLDVSGLNGIITVPGSLDIYQNPSMTDLVGLHNVTTISSTLYIRYNASLSNLNGLAGLTSIGGLNIESNAMLSSLSGLSNVTAVNGAIGITQNPNLSSLAGLDNINHTGISYLRLTSNGTLSICDVQSICNYLDNGGSSNISSNATGCNSEAEIGAACNTICPSADITFATQADIDNFATNYPNCTAIDYKVTIQGSGITNLNGLSMLTSIGDDFRIENTSISSLGGLENLTSVNGELHLVNNFILTNLEALSNLTSINGILQVGYHTALTNLFGLENISPTGITTLIIWYNDQLSLCSIENFCEYLGTGGSSVITTNASHCNDETEVLADCADYRFTGTGLWTDAGNWSPSYPGTAVLSGEKVRLLGDCTVPSGITVTLNGTAEVIGSLTTAAGSMLGGTGNVTANGITNEGSLMPGSSPGTLNFVNGFENTNGTIEIELGGTTPGTGYDVINVTNSLALAGTINVVFVNGFTPGPADIFDIINANSITSTATVNWPAGYDGTVSYPSGKVRLSGLALLPVELVAFQALPKDETVVLQWQTTSETNNKGFEIQRSSDGRNWQVLAFVPGYGTTFETHSYSHTDQQPFSGINHYRLRQLDFDGQEEYSSIVSINLRDKWAQVHVYPNPFSTALHIQLPQHTEGRWLARLLDVTGKTHWQGLLDGGLEFIELPELRAGVYWLELKNEGRKTQLQVMKF